MTAGRTASFAVGAILVGIASAALLASPHAADRAEICQPGYARSHRLPPSRYYPIAEAAFARAGIPWAERHKYRLDHIRPLCLGGGWEPSNLQVQTIDAAAAKDVTEVRACRMVCAGEMSIDDAQRWFRRETR